MNGRKIGTMFARFKGTEIEILLRTLALELSITFTVARNGNPITRKNNIEISDSVHVYNASLMINQLFNDESNKFD